MVNEASKEFFGFGERFYIRIRSDHSTIRMGFLLVSIFHFLF